MVRYPGDSQPQKLQQLLGCTLPADETSHCTLHLMATAESLVSTQLLLIFIQELCRQLFSVCSLHFLLKRIYELQILHARYVLLHLHLSGDLGSHLADGF